MQIWQCMDSPQEWSKQLQRAAKLRQRANAELADTSIQLGKDRTQYFEKLAIGSGAVIAAVVSFLGTHAIQLHPRYPFRSSLVALVLTAVFAMYRNFRYPSYILAAKHRVLMEKDRGARRIDIKSYLAGVTTVDDEGKVIDATTAKADFALCDKDLTEAVEKSKKLENWRIREWQTAERTCLAAASVAMICLVWLAIQNF
jgi:hypothetical protein